jgi:LPS-assembly protein
LPVFSFQFSERLALGLCGVLAATAAQAGPGIDQHPRGTPAAVPLTANAPVTFQADSVSYDKEHGLVSALGHVEAWQNGHILRADRVTFDRNTNVVAAYGHVVIVEPTGEVIFADYAELTQGMKDGALTGMRALLAQNGKLAGNGGKRVEGKLNELSRAVYSPCNVCALDPTPTWQLRATNITQDLENKRLEYTNATLDFLGWPVFWMPFFSNSDPSVKRQSGFLMPNMGNDEYIGSFFALPYYWVIDDNSDATFTPTVSTIKGPQVQVEYRRDFNFGNVLVDSAIANDGGLQGYFYGSGNFSYNDTWRYGFNINLGSTVQYLKDFQIPGYGAAILTSSVFAEGFGSGSYARVDIRSYQGLNSTINQSLLPYVLPRYQYSFVSEPDILGGRVSFDTVDFDVLRDVGTNDQRLAGDLAWNRPFAGLLGDRWLVTLDARGAYYHATNLDQQPNFSIGNYDETVHVQPQAAVRLNWPFVRADGSGGSQIIEPIAQIIAAPNAGNSTHDRIPNEDSLDYEFTDSTLFSINRFGGYDRSDGGTRANYALHASWTFASGSVLDGLIGQSWQEHIDQNLYPQFQPWNGFGRGRHSSDLVGRVGFIPNKWFDFTARARVDQDTGDIRFADAVFGVGRPILRFQSGFLYGSTNPYFLYATNPNALAGLTPAQNAAFFVPREEVSAGVSTKFGRYLFGLDARRDLEEGKFVSIGAHARYEDECFAFDIKFYKRYTEIAGDTGDTTLLFTVLLKTIGPIGFSG